MEKEDTEGALNEPVVDLEALMEKVSRITPPILTVNTNKTRYSTVVESVKELGWSIGNSTWNLWWNDNGGNTAEGRIASLHRLHKFNHFPGMSKICQKCKLGLTISRLSSEHPGLFDFCPQTFCLPREKESLLKWFHSTVASSKQKPVLIAKPDGGCQGNGIFLTNSLKALKKLKGLTAVQQYISNPYLINGFKFDLRLYVAVTSCTPRIRAFLHEEGLVRFATQKYSVPRHENLSDRFMHLTNYSVNKKNVNYAQEEKWALSDLFCHLQQNQIDVSALKERIEDLVVRTLLATKDNLEQEYRAFFQSETSVLAQNVKEGFRCFEILGFDVMIDSELKPWLIEVNHSPSLHGDSELDRRIKTTVIKESLVLGAIDADDLLTGEAGYRQANQVEERLVFQSIFDQKNIHSFKFKHLIPILSELRTVYEDTHCGSFKRILPWADDCPHSQVYERILSYKSPLYKESPVTRRRRMVTERERAKFQEAQNYHRLKVGDRPAWGGGGVAKYLPDIFDKRSNQLEEDVELNHEESKQKIPAPLPRVAFLKPTLRKEKKQKFLDVNLPPTSREQCKVHTQTISFEFDD